MDVSTLTGDALKRELERRSHDLIMVENPTDKDFIFTWDNRPHKIRAHEKKTLERFLAEHYAKKMVISMINDLGEKNVQDLIRKKEKTMGIPMRPDEKQMLYESHGARTDDPQYWEQYYPLFFLGVVEEYGIIELTQPEEDRSAGKSVEEATLEKLGNKRYVMDEPVNQHDLSDVAERVLED